ncbi:hypothetical protein JL721_9274 [Aureococcus anophagefferens]|nr:hypothetical protein JL721_9274 [Aureococcus anophagefferens]
MRSLVALAALAVADAGKKAKGEYSWDQAKCLFKKRKIVFLGDSNTRFFSFQFATFLEKGEYRSDDYDKWGEPGDDYDKEYEDETWTDWSRKSKKSATHAQHLKAWFGEATKEENMDDIAAKVKKDKVDIVVMNSGWWDLKGWGEKDYDDCGEDWEDDCGDAYERDAARFDPTSICARDVKKAADEIFSGAKAAVWRDCSCCGDETSHEKSVKRLNAIAKDVMDDRGYPVAEIFDLYGKKDLDDATVDGTHATPEYYHAWTMKIMTGADVYVVLRASAATAAGSSKKSSGGLSSSLLIVLFVVAVAFLGGAVGLAVCVCCRPGRPSNPVWKSNLQPDFNVEPDEAERGARAREPHGRAEEAPPEDDDVRRLRELRSQRDEPWVASRATPSGRTPGRTPRLSVSGADNGYREDLARLAQLQRSANRGRRAPPRVEEKEEDDDASRLRNLTERRQRAARRRPRPRARAAAGARRREPLPPRGRVGVAPPVELAAPRGPHPDLRDGRRRFPGFAGSLVPGDRITILDSNDDEWWRGETPDGAVGAPGPTWRAAPRAAGRAGCAGFAAAGAGAARAAPPQSALWRLQQATLQ